MAAVILVIAGSSPRPAPAELLVKGTGQYRVLVREQFSRAQLPAYDLFAVKCTRCHRMARVIDALTWGTTPITGSKFDDASIAKYVVKMLRKSKSGIGKEDARILIDFLRGARKLAQEPPAHAPAPPAPPAPHPAPAPAHPDAGIIEHVPDDAGATEGSP